MKTFLFCLVTITQLVLFISAEPIQKIPLFYKRHHESDFSSIGAQELYNGMLGGVVQIGNPPQNVTLAFDTSTGFSWVRTINCTSDNCQCREPFDPKNSTTLISTSKSFNMHYGKAKVCSTIYIDTFRFAGLTVKNMPFGGAYNMVGFDRGFDGFLGLGRNVNLNDSVNQYAKRDIPASGFIPNAYQSSSGVQSAQFGMYTTSSSSSFSDTGSVNAGPANTQSSNNQNSMPNASSNTASNNAPNASSNNSPNSSSSSSNSSPHSSLPNSSSPNTSSNTSSNNSPNTPSSQNSGSGSTVTSGGYGTVTSGGYGHIKRHYNEKPAGYLVIGGIDHDAIKGKLYHIKLAEDTDSGNWAVPVRQAGFVDGLQFRVHRHSKAVLSSNTDVIGLPNKQADEFKKHWFAEYDGPDNTYKIPCCLMGRLSAFNIKLGNVNAEIPPHYWSHRRHTETCCELCRTHIGRSGSDTDYVVGSSFTNAFYTQFDSEKERISLGMKKTHVQDGLSLCDA